MPFTENDHRLFVGRTREIDGLITSLYGSSLSVLYGESGVGKTSLLRAGLLPKIRDKEPRIVPVLFRDWQESAFEKDLRQATLNSLLQSINRLRSVDKKEPVNPEILNSALLKGLPQDSKKSLEDIPFDAFVRICSAACRGRLFFIFDQFEDYIYYHPASGDGGAFDASFARIVNDPETPAGFLLSLRDDGLGKLGRLRERIPNLLGNIIKLEHLTRGGADEAMKAPLTEFNASHKQTKVELEETLATTLLDQSQVSRFDVGDFRLPNDENSPEGTRRYKALVLQAVLTRLWNAVIQPVLDKGNAPNGLLLTLQSLRDLAKNKDGNETEVYYVFRTYFDEYLKELTKRERSQAVEIFGWLVRAGGGKRARTVTELAQKTRLPKDEIQSLVTKLTARPFNLLRRIDVKKIGPENTELSVPDERSTPQPRPSS